MGKLYKENSLRAREKFMEYTITYLAPNWLDCMIAHLYYQTSIAKAFKHNDKNKTQISSSKILLVEDDPLVQTINSEYLRISNFKVDIANNYWEAVKLYKTGIYNLIITDVGLPGKNGIELCRKIRELERSKTINTPIVIVTAYGDNIEQECYKAGANHFAIKPLLQKELVKIVTNLIKQSNL